MPLERNGINPRRAFIIGAGMSGECGAPTIANFLSDSFLAMVHPEKSAKLKVFLEAICSTDFSNNIEQILSLIDHSIINGESLNGYSPEKLKKIRIILLESINEILTHIWAQINDELGFDSIDNPYAAQLSNGKTDIVHEKILRDLLAEMRSLSQDDEITEETSTEEVGPLARGWIDSYVELVAILKPHDTIINFNYDNFLELALSILIERYQIDYGFDYIELSPDTDVLCHGDIYQVSRPPESLKYKLNVFRPHGSLNWGICSYCGQLIGTYLTPLLGVKPYFELIKSEAPKTKERHFCCKGFDPQLLIIPPTKRKFYYQRYVVEVINASADYLSKCDELYFLGYSFSEIDTIMQDMLDRARFLREGKKWGKVVVVNRSIDKVKNNYLKKFSQFEVFNGNVSDFLKTMDKYGKPFRDPPRTHDVKI